MYCATRGEANLRIKDGIQKINKMVKEYDKGKKIRRKKSTVEEALVFSLMYAIKLPDYFSFSFVVNLSLVSVVTEAVE